MIRLAIAGFSHETNTFSTTPASRDRYEQDGLHEGQALVDHYGSSQATLAGFLANTPDVPTDLELVPILAAWVNPCGAITEEAFEMILDRITRGIEARGPFDGVLLALHGAAVADHVRDADAEIVSRVRHAVGNSVKIGAVLDMHANVSNELVDILDLVFPYQTNPHVDARLKGIECRQRLIETITARLAPRTALRRLPLAANIVRQDTSELPMSRLLETAAAFERDLGVWDASIVEGFPYADVEQMGMSVLVTHRDTQDVAERVADMLADAVWEAREELQGGAVEIDEALQRVRHYDGADPLLLLDVGDNVGAGGPGDSTVILERALRLGIEEIAFTINDPEAVLELANALPGDRVTVALGARTASSAGSRKTVRGVVTGRSDGLYEEPRMAHGGLRYFDAGAMVAVATDRGLVVVLTSKLVQPITPNQLTSAGVDLGRLRAVVAKGVNGPRAGYADICPEHIVVDSPGITRLSIEGLSYRHRPRPMYPFERDAERGATSD